MENRCKALYIGELHDQIWRSRRDCTLPERQTLFTVQLVCKSTRIDLIFRIRREPKGSKTDSLFPTKMFAFLHIWKQLKHSLEWQNEPELGIAN